MKIACKGLQLFYTKSETMTQEVFTILAPTNFDVYRHSLTWSPLLDKRQFLTPNIDFTDLDYAQTYEIKMRAVQMKCV